MDSSSSSSSVFGRTLGETSGSSHDQEISSIKGDGSVGGISVDDVHRAAKSGDALTVAEFLDAGGDANAKLDIGSSTMLSRAAAKGDTMIVTLLLKNGAAINEPGRGGFTPLHEAASCGQLEVCRILLENGAAIAARDHARRSPLHYAAASNSVAVTKLLLSFGASPNMKDKNRLRPDGLSVNAQARAVLRNARFAVREDEINAAQGIAFPRRDTGVTVAAATQTDLELDMTRLRGENARLSAELDYQKIQATVARASVRQAHAAASAERRRRREEVEAGNPFMRWWRRLFCFPSLEDRGH